MQDHDPLNCQTQPRLPYIADAEDADRRLAAGENQTFCQTCERYRWADEQCDRFAEGADPWVEDDEEFSEEFVSPIISHTTQVAANTGIGIQ